MKKKKSLKSVHLSEKQLDALGVSHGSLILESEQESMIIPKHSFLHTLEDIVSHTTKLREVQEIIEQRLASLLGKTNKRPFHVTSSTFPSWFACYLDTASGKQTKALAKVFGVK